METNNMKKWGFKEATAFEGLMPKTMEILGDDYCEGACNEVVSSFDPQMASPSLNQAADAMKVVSPTDIME